MCNKYYLLGMIVLAFGAGVLLSFFLPAKFLALAEAAVIIAAGLLYLKGR